MTKMIKKGDPDRQPGKIAVLTEEVINKIAAGEVIERPASVVKELVENAIDAGAKRIVIQIGRDPIEYIQVTDDGFGIEPEDVPLAFERHATSKIHSAEDIFRIDSLGFRGEALPSIAAVSSVTMITRPKGGGVATKIELKGGQVLSVGESGGPEGTSVIVRDLFYNTPARRKYLRSVNTECGHIYDIVGAISLSHPEISFLLYRDDRLVISTDGSGDYSGAVSGIYGPSVSKELISVSMALEGISLLGLIGKPDLSRTGRDGERFFVNGRVVQNRTMYAALENAFGGSIPRGKHPVAFIWFSMDPETLDVNVHPTKREVRFAREDTIYKLTFDAAKQALRQLPGAKPLDVSETSATSYMAHVNRSSMPYIARENLSRASYAARGNMLFESYVTRPAAASIDGPAALSIDRPGEAPDDHESAEAVKPSTEPPQAQIPTLSRDFTVIGQFHDTYLILEAEECLYLLDQHAAHERILYENLIRSFNSKAQIKQKLLAPVTIQPGPRFAAEMEGKLYLFEGIGFEIEPFGKDTFLVRAIPAIIAERPKISPEDLLLDAITQTTERGGDGLRLDLHGLAAVLACKGAIKAGEKLSHPEMERLLSDLFKTDEPLLCPHGRPTLAHIDLREIEGWFRRPKKG